MRQEPIRVFTLAQQLHVDSREILDAARTLGLNLSNSLSRIPPDQRAALEEYVQRTVPRVATSPQLVSSSTPDPDADETDSFDDDMDEADFDEDMDAAEFGDDAAEVDRDEGAEEFDDEDDEDENTGGGSWIDRTREREYREDYDPEEDDKEPGDFEAEGPEGLECDPDYN